MISAPEYVPLNQEAQILAPPVDPHSEIPIFRSSKIIAVAILSQLSFRTNVISAPELVYVLKQLTQTEGH